jgi:AraC-like DNA-binding protein/plasmid maintenance system antidote protein VapI
MSESFADKITQLRAEREITIDMLAEACGISVHELIHLEKGVFCASREHIMRLSRYFGIDFRELLALNQASKIELEKMIAGDESVSRSGIVKNSVVGKKRMYSMQRELEILTNNPMTVKFYIPSGPLEDYVESIVYCKAHHLGYPFERIIPDGVAQLQIAIGKGAAQWIDSGNHMVAEFADSWLIGMCDIPITYKLSGEGGVVYVRFRPAGLHAFTRLHQTQFTNSIMSGERVFGDSIILLSEKIGTLEAPNEIITEVERYFLSRMDQAVAPPLLISYMLEHLDLPLTDLAREMGYSSKYLTRAFQRYIGIGPKNLQRIQRFNACLLQLNQSSTLVDWPLVVFKNGFHDQAHFIKDFKQFTGFNPQNYLATGAACTRYMHLKSI